MVTSNEVVQPELLSVPPQATVTVNNHMDIVSPKIINIPDDIKRKHVYYTKYE